MTPWSAPQSGPPAHALGLLHRSPPARTAAPACTAKPRRPNQPEFRAGTLSPNAGAYSPFVLKLRREDGTQRIADLSGDTAAGADGQARRHPPLRRRARSPPPSSTAAKPSGRTRPAPPTRGSAAVGGRRRRRQRPLLRARQRLPRRPLPGGADLAGGGGAGGGGPLRPRHGGRPRRRCGSISRPARSGCESDPIPSVLSGVALDVRSIAVKLDRPDFTLNPTSCVPATTKLGG